MQLYTAAGTILVLLSALEGSRRLNRRADRDIVRVEGFIALMRYVRTQIDCYALPLEEIFGRCDKNILIRCGYYDEALPKDFSVFFNRLDIKDKELRRIMLDFSADFGKHYREEQLKRCDACIVELEALSESARQAVASRKKLNVTLCLSGAAALIILLI